MDITLILTILGIAATLIAPAAGYILKQRKEYKNYYSVLWKSTGSLKAKDMLGERPFDEYYFKRELDKQLLRSVTRRRSALVVGPPLSGKTRAVFNALKQQKKNADLLVPRNVSMPSFIFPKNYKFWKDKIIFIDDLQYYIEKHDNYHLLFKHSKDNRIPIIATCHSGREYKKVKNKMIEQNMDIESIFGEEFFELDKISADDGRKVAESLGMKWDNVKFNGTIGSIFMRLSEMERRFDQCDNIEKTILRVLRNQYLSGVYEDNSIFRIEWVKKYAGMFELEARDFEWTGWLKTLEDKEFIKIARRNKIWAEDAYLEYVVKPQVEISQIEIFEDVIESFADTPEVLMMAGERAYDLGIVEVQLAEYMRICILAFEKALESIDRTNNQSLYIKAQSYLGQAYWSLSKVQNTLENCTKSVEYYNEILKYINVDSHPFEYAKIKNRIGNTYTAFAEVENKVQNCMTAISAYNEALKVFSIERNPTDYARAFNNIGGAYLILAEEKEPKQNFKKALESFNEALRVRTAAEFPKYYALTKNNVANTYAKLSNIENSEENLKLAIEAYQDILKIYSKEKYPQQYGLTMNNIGNAYSLLSAIKDRKLNSEKAIEAYEKALEVRPADQVPTQYANTIFNLGDAYLALSETENESESLYKAIDYLEESLQYWSREKYPLYFGLSHQTLAKAYIKLAAIEDKTENYHKGIKAYDLALEVFTEDNSPEIYHSIQTEISQAKKIFF
jgi:tetratricopeptide (TPR) repeat protein